MASPKPKYTRILSIDGGGLRGILPGTILEALEAKLQQSAGADARIADHFDLIAGTSTGGILTCMYVCPSSDDPKRPRLSAAEAVNLYLDRGDEIFDIPIWHKITSGAGVFDEKYPVEELEDALKDNLGERRLGEAVTECLVTSYDIRRRAAVFFTRQDAIDRPDAKNFLLRDVARATSAAPSYFEAARIRAPSGMPYPLIDGGVFANNPAMCAYAEARKRAGRPSAKDMFLLSIGTGTIATPYYWKEAKDFGLAQWIRPVLDIMMSGVAETVDYQLGQLFDAAKAKRQYIRIKPDLGDASPDLDNASKENLDALRRAGLAAAKAYDKQLDVVVGALLATR